MYNSRQEKILFRRFRNTCCSTAKTNRNSNEIFRKNAAKLSLFFGLTKFMIMVGRSFFERKLICDNFLSNSHRNFDAESLANSNQHPSLFIKYFVQIYNP